MKHSSNNIHLKVEVDYVF